ncbi:amidohydrolase [Staphylococcus pseudoxylosus]|uniref:Amidohydrolase n=1 Tax=Staphylococcus pseudoxylosus TaxID=2282419 RepID=A0AAQ0S6R5_9STAP|nr:amidohydrolase [Staphylococcus pseudoxylosus]PTI83569.1 amidohydrolase [Staphylococcus xylosus]MBM2659270.1 amidohydrolase [Staphylococcus pseudoxylosus]MCE5002320.1 amidohydrolase [Staphylococcus pseudoxylosus]MEB5781975.1 amidohydrolase [Staphylococcus pseudoxylosus]RMI85137.1 amidohydrolase [Staphylococcus pseudoxylosus]
MNVKEKLFEKLEQKEADMVQHRRYLHQHPELSFQENATAEYIKAFYKDKDVVVTQPVAESNAIIVEIKGQHPGNTIGLRADFDALPIHEEADVPFKSKNEGVMHACGHDAHTAYLLGLADALIDIKDELPGTIKIIHQHAEEMPPGGAQQIMASGALSDLDEVYGIHVVPVAGPEVIGYNTGNAFAGSSTFTLTIKGLGGHAASPHKTHDALVAGTNFVNTLQTIVSRRIDPSEMGVVTVGSFDAPGGANVIQDKVTIKGTARYLNDDLEQFMYEEIEKVAKSVAVGFDITYDLDYQFGYPVLYNHPDQTQAVTDILSTSQGDYFKHLVEIPAVSGSEDFAYYLKEIPGTFFIVGCKPEHIEDPYMNHHPKFEVNENALLVSAKSLGEIAINRLSAKA